MSYGGPHYGFMAARTSYIRRLPGRIVGETHDPRGKRGVRPHAPDPRAAHPAREGDLEHHDQPDAAGAGGAGLPVLARPGGARRHRAGLPVARRGGKRVVGLPQRSTGRRSRSSRSTWAGRPRPSSGRRAPQGVHPGYPLGRDYPGMENAPPGRLTEKRTRADIARLAEVLGSVKLVYERSRPGRRAGRVPETGVRGRRRPAELRRAKPPRLPEIAEPDLVRHFTELSTRDVRDRHGLLSARLVHDEVQPARQRARGGARRVPRPAPASGRRGRPGRARADVAARADAGRGGGARRRDAPAGGRVAGRAHRPHPDARVLRRPRRGAHARSSSPTRRTARTRPALPWPATRSWASRPTRAATSTSTTSRGKVGPQTAGLMLTNPSTLGLFEERITEIADIFHDAGALLYYDGANLNAVFGISRPGDMGFDVVHFNLHKTFSQPHGGGGPGGGPVAVRDMLDAVPARAAHRPHRRRVRLRLGRAEDDRQGARVRGAVRRVRPLLRVHADVGPGAPAHVRGRRAQRQLRALAAARRLRPARRPPLHARVRASRRGRSGASTA